LSVPAVKSRLLRARLQLRERLSRYFQRREPGEGKGNDVKNGSTRGEDVKNKDVASGDGNL
jgi:hypothetical protein